METEKSLEQEVVDMLFEKLVHECRKKENGPKATFKEDVVKNLARRFVQAEKQLNEKIESEKTES